MKLAITKIKNFFEKHYILLLLIILLISYGQILAMTPWQDDQTLFFKLAHIRDKAGYFGYGPIGEGSYKYIVTPYIPIYKVFGFNETAYFVYTFLFYFIASVTVYLVFTRIISRSAGKVAGFLFASGYIASDGFIRIFNSVTTSSSIILNALLTLSYWNYYKTKGKFWYFMSLFVFFLAIELFRIRTHYLISVVVIFEFLFLSFEKFPSSLLKSVVRTIPFVFLFYLYFVANPDGRSVAIRDLINGLFDGKYYLTYGFLSSFSNLIIPDWFRLLIGQTIGVHFTNILFLLMLSTIPFILFFKCKRFLKILSFISLILLLAWFFISKGIFVDPSLNVSPSELITPFIGAALLIVLGLITFGLNAKYRKLFLFFVLWGILNLAAYSAYSPTVSYGSVQRYLSHSFYAVVGILVVLFEVVRNKYDKLSKLTVSLIIFWGLGNCLNSFLYQRNILYERSFPVKKFYKELTTELPKIEKGNVLYFDIADNTRSYFANAFSVASMPEETAIAWRYGVDRYDFRRVTSFHELSSLVKKGSFGDINDRDIRINNIHTFFYSNKNLIDTSQDTKNFLTSQVAKMPIEFIQKMDTSDPIMIEPKREIKSVTPLEFEINLSALPLSSSEIKFPYLQQISLSKNGVALDKNLRQEAFEYLKDKEKIIKDLKVVTSSDWRENVSKNAVDENPQTVWRPDRVLWSKGEEYLALDLGSMHDVNRLVWINAYSNNSPTKYSVEISDDGRFWKEVANISSQKRIESSDLQIIDFKPAFTRFVKMKLVRSLNDDSPGISEIWVVPTKYKNMNIKDAEEFLANPFGFVPDKESFVGTLSELNLMGIGKIYWLSNKSDDWLSDISSKIQIRFNGNSYSYKFIIRSSGTKITKIKISDIQIPGTIKINSLFARHLNLSELLKDQ